MTRLKNIKYFGLIGFYFIFVLTFINKIRKGHFLDDKSFLKKRFLKAQGYPLNLTNPKTLNEKLQVLKFSYNKTIHQLVSDKIEVRNFLKNLFGEQYLIPQIYVTENYRTINKKILPKFPVIIKSNHDAGNYVIIRDKEKVNWRKLRVDCKWWLSFNYYNADREQQYKNIKRKILIEKLLLDSNGKIPNDYKLNYINGNLEFIYVSVDREGGNFRNIYNSEWEPENFKWASAKKMNKTQRGPEISPPKSFKKMKEFGLIIAKLFPYVRVDFYDVDGKLYFGEITLCHGGGFYKFEPIKVDLDLGEKLLL